MTNHYDQSATPDVVLSDSNENNGTRAIRDVATKGTKISSTEEEHTTRNQTNNHAHVELQGSPEAPSSTELRIGCSTGDHHFDAPMVVLPPTPPKHSQGLGGIKDEFTGMSTPLSVVTVYRSQQ